MSLRKLFIIAMLSVALSVNANEESHPEGEVGNYIVEFTSGVVFEDSEDVFEVGFEIERFIDGTSHQFSIGLATEIEFKEHQDEFYIGPIFSFYYAHIKTFFTSGILTDFEGINEWKNRLGFGYEFFVTDEFLIVPFVALDYVVEEFNPALGLGLAYKF